LCLFIPNVPSKEHHAMTITEHRDLTIPLAIRITPAQTRSYEGWWHPTAAIAADPIIRQYVTAARREGWEPEGPTNFLRLVSNDRVQYTAKYGAISAEWKYTDFVSVSIPMRRIVP
jgi:hypothetical protein